MNTQNNHNNITAQQAYELLSKRKAILIDVREDDEFKTEHISYAISLPLSNISNFAQYINPSPQQKIIFQCQHGKRAEKACRVITTSHLGFKQDDIFTIDGGIEGWRKAHLPLVRATKAKLPVFRQVQIIIGLLVLIFSLLGLFGQIWATYLAGFLGFAFAIAGITGWCGLGILLSKAPWNK